MLMAIFPWNSFGEQGSPFVLIFDGLGIRRRRPSLTSL
nr:putative proline-specific permease [Klebsiella pneumoniae]